MDSREHLFTAKQSNGAQFKTSLDVFLAFNRNQDVADFKVKGNWFEKRCIVFVGESTTAIAEVTINIFRLFHVLLLLHDSCTSCYSMIITYTNQDLW